MLDPSKALHVAITNNGVEQGLRELGPPPSYQILTEPYQAVFFFSCKPENLRPDRRTVWGQKGYWKYM